MTLSSTISSVSFAGNDSTTEFSFPYLFLADGDLVVTLAVDSTGVETVQTITTHYTVSGAGDQSGGTVTMVTEPATGETLVIERVPAATQGLDLVENDPFPSDQVEQALDRGAMVDQVADERYTRTVHVQKSDTYDGDEPHLPIRANRLNNISGWDENGDIEAKTLASIGSVVISDDTPAALGTAAAGTSAEVSRSDHVHKLPTGAELSLEIGVDTQAYSADLDNVSGTNTGDEVAATTTVAGVVEKSTSGENVAGTEAEKYPDVPGVKEMIDTHSAGGLVPISSASASTSATIDFTGLDSTYDEYKLVIVNLVPETDATVLWARVAEAGPTWKSGASDYRWAFDLVVDSAAVVPTGDTADSEIELTNNTVGSTGGENLNGVLTIYAPAGTSNNKVIGFEVRYDSSTPRATSVGGAGVYYGATNAIVGIRIMMSSGNIASGEFHLYGVKKA